MFMSQRKSRGPEELLQHMSLPRTSPYVRYLWTPGLSTDYYWHMDQGHVSCGLREGLQTPEEGRKSPEGRSRLVRSISPEYVSSENKGEGP